VLPRERLPVHLVGEHHVRDPPLLERQIVDVRNLGRDELEPVRAGLRLRLAEDVGKADTRPLDVLHGPAGDAVEVGNLTRPRQSAKLVVGE